MARPNATLPLPVTILNQVEMEASAFTAQVVFWYYFFMMFIIYEGCNSPNVSQSDGPWTESKAALKSIKLTRQRTAAPGTSQ